jgi:hypothetical protein
MAKAKETEVTEDSLVSKLSIKQLGCDPRLAAGTTTKVLCRIYGTAKGLKHGEDKNTGNMWTALQGEFEGVNVEQGNEDFGKILRSGKLFLPAGIQDVVEGAVREIENSKDGAETPNVVFGLEIRSVKSNNRIGYSYEAKNLMPPAQQDPLAVMRAAIESKAGPVKALPAPKEK